jgi:putative acetyltransferase
MTAPLDASLSIRPAVDSDGPRLADLIRTVFAEYENCPYVSDEFPELAAPASSYAARGGVLWVAERKAAGGEAQLVGSLAIAPAVDPGDFELLKVYAAASERGRGLAARLLAHAVAYAAERGGRRLVLWSDSRFTRGHAFYRKHGFKPTPGIRALHDVGVTLELGFARDLADAS